MFAFRLADELGLWDVDGMLSQMPSRLIYEWAAYYQLEPFGEERGDLRNGILCSLVAGALGNKNVKPVDFMPFSDAASRRQTPEQMLNVARMFTGAWNSAKGK